MSDPTPQKPVKLSAPEPEAPEFDLLAFWIQYRGLITKLVALVAIAAIGWGVYAFTQMRKREGSENALAAAKSPEDLRKVATQWEGTGPAGTALVQLANDLRTNKDYAGAEKVLNDFLAKYPEHPLKATALIGLGTTLEFAGKNDDALRAYQRVVTELPNSAEAGQVLISQARVYKAQDKLDDARRVIAVVQKDFANMPFAQDATAILDAINNPGAKVTGGTPRPTPPAPPVPTTPLTPTPGAPNAPAAPAMPAPAVPAPVPAAPEPATSAPVAPATPAPAPATPPQAQP